METIETIFLVLTYVAAIGFLISGLDDLFFDAQFLRYLWRQRKKPKVTLPELERAPEQWIAIFVPAWQKGGVVNRMAEYATRVLQYEKYDIFLGVYPNDPETNRCVDEVCARNPRLHKVLVPQAGPTCKADCLNWIYRAMKLHEIPGRREYRVIALHDAEDVLHPLVLKVYNHHVPREYDMAQIPVFALEFPIWKFWTANTYVDDFAELHTKDLFVRQSLGGFVPSAGVGTAFTRTVLDQLAGANGGDPFRVGNLTEDYEIGIRVKNAGFRSGMVSVPIERVVREKKANGTPGAHRTVREIVAVREVFPQTFAAAVRQRSRWILGISFQTWEQTGWPGTLPMRYTLLRDRRAPLTHLINMMGYVVLAWLVWGWIFRHTPWAADLYLRPAFNPDSWLWKLMIIDTGLLAYRCVQKFISVYSLYGFAQAAMAPLRMVVNNVINFAATARATRTFLAHKLFGTPIVWLKTDHVFPGTAELAEYTRTIEDLIVERGLATREQIAQALQREKTGSAMTSLLRMGLLDEGQYLELWAQHSGLPVRFVSPQEVPAALLEHLPEAKAIELGALPVEATPDHVVVAFAEPPSRANLEELSHSLGLPVKPVLARASNLTFAREQAYPSLVLPRAAALEFWHQFRSVAHVESPKLTQALHRHQTSRQSLPDVMVSLGLITEPQARRLWARAIGCAPAETEELRVNEELYWEVGPAFWWVHRLLPFNWDTIAAAAPVHPRTADWLARKMAANADFVGELPGRLALGVELDPDQWLIDHLVKRRLLKERDLPQLNAVRALMVDPLPRWLVLQQLVTEEELHTTFVEASHLPPCSGWKADAVMRLAPVLPPGFAAEHGCYCLEENEGRLRIGLAQLPSAAALRVLYDRLGGRPIVFEAVSHADALTLHQLVSQ